MDTPGRAAKPPWLLGAGDDARDAQSPAIDTSTELTRPCLSYKRKAAGLSRRLAASS